MSPMYDYKAFNSSGSTEKGFVEADSPKSARQKLKKQGLMVTEIKEKNTSRPTRSGGVPFLSGRIGSRDLALITRQLASLVKANVPLVEALGALVEQTEKERLKVILSTVRQDVNEGSSLAKAMGKHPKVFDRIFVNMVEAGENSGTLGLVLIRLADLKEAQLRLRNKVVSGMTYPLIMLAVGFVLVIAIFTFVIPKLTKIFETMDKPIPPTTQILMVLSSVVLDYWYLIGFVIVVSFILFQRYIQSEKGRPRWDAFKLSLPVFGSFFRMVAITRFSSTMSTLLSSGVPILSGMTIAKNLVGNHLIEYAIEQARENIKEGQSIAEPLKKSMQFPPLVIHMISIGEKTGELPEMLDNVAQTYEEQVSATIERMTSLLEPIMIVLMGGFVAFIVMSIFIPLLEVSNIQ